jgi:hypothetical protein
MPIMLAIKHDLLAEPPAGVPWSLLRRESASSSDQPAEPSLSSSSSTPSHRSFLVSPTDTTFPKSATLTRRTSRFGSISFPNPFGSLSASTSSSLTTTYTSYEDAYDAPKDVRRKSSNNRMTQIFHRKSGSNARAQSVDAANPSSINGGDDHRPNVTSSKRNSITNVKDNLKSLFNSSSAPSNPSLIKTSPPANLPPASFHPSHPPSDSVPPPSNDQSVAIGAYSVEGGSSEPAAVPSVEWVPPVLPTAYVNRTVSAEGPLGERLEEGQKSRPGKSMISLHSQT